MHAIFIIERVQVPVVLVVGFFLSVGQPSFATPLITMVLNDALVARRRSSRLSFVGIILDGLARADPEIGTEIASSFRSFFLDSGKAKGSEIHLLAEQLYRLSIVFKRRDQCST